MFASFETVPVIRSLTVSELTATSFSLSLLLLISDCSPFDSLNQLSLLTTSTFEGFNNSEILLFGAVSNEEVGCLTVTELFEGLFKEIVNSDICDRLSVASCVTFTVFL